MSSKPAPPFALPSKQSGKIILLAQVTAKPGEGDKLKELIAAVRKAAESSGEKDTHTYRTTRAADDPDKFVIFEEYSLPNGIVDHVAGDAFQALANAGLIEKLDVQYFEEFA